MEPRPAWWSLRSSKDLRFEHPPPFFLSPILAAVACSGRAGAFPPRCARCCWTSASSASCGSQARQSKGLNEAFWAVGHVGHGADGSSTPIGQTYYAFEVNFEGKAQPGFL